MDQIIEIGVKCAKCGVKFNTRQMGVIFDTGYRNSELRHCPDNGVSVRTEPYIVATCPSCGKADWATNFQTIEETPQSKQQTSPAHLQYRAAAIEGERDGAPWFDVGLLYLHAAWCADDARAVPQSREYRKLAAEAFRKSLLDDSIPPQELMEVQYLIGEILRRAGDFAGSISYFKEVVPRLSSQYAFMARKLIRLAEQQDTNPIDFERVGAN